jgi:hypothetical protein
MYVSLYLEFQANNLYIFRLIWKVLVRRMFFSSIYLSLNCGLRQIQKKVLKLTICKHLGENLKV